MLQNQRTHLQKVRKDGSEHERTSAERDQQVTTQITSSYQRFRDEDVSKRDYLKPQEGDEEWNARLEKAVKFVDSTLRTNPKDPKLTAQQLEDAVRKHAAMRNRAVGFSMLKLQNRRLAAENTELKKRLGEYGEVEPGGGEGDPAGGAGTAPPTSPGGFMEDSFRELESRGR
jgi:hypothetical protein